MDWQRNILIAAIVAVLFLLFIRWNQFQEAKVPEQESFVQEAVVVPPIEAGGQAVTESVLPEAEDASLPREVAKTAEKSSRLVTVETDVLHVTIDTLGGDIVRVALPQHLDELHEDGGPFVLLNRSSRNTYIAQSGLVGSDGTDTREGRPLFSVSGYDHVMESGQDELVVDLQLNQDGVDITKRFHFRRGDYLVDVDYVVTNNGQEPWKANLFGQIQRDSHEVPGPTNVGMRAFLGAALTTDEENYKKLDFEDIADSPFKTEKTGGWVSMVQHYFISAWIPDQQLKNTFNLRKLSGRDLYVMGFTSPATVVAPGETATIGAGFYAGPKDQYRLEKISPYLDLTVDYGWLWWVAKPIFWLMTQIHALVGNWGWSIILLTVLIKGAFFKLSATSYRSMAKMRKLQPEMQRLKELYGDDRQKLSQEMMNFYKKEKVNPMSGCLPILVQMPVFIALYWVLFESVELRHAPWILWISDLSVKDPYFVLPVLNGISMFFTTLLQPEPPDPTQAKVMKIMPVAFSFLFAFFPAGLVLYWTVNSVLSIIQQWVITRRIEAAG